MKKNIFKQSALLLKDNLMVVQPLFLGALFIMLIFMPLYSKQSLDVGFYFSLIIAFLCSAALAAGCGNCVKYVISVKDKTYDTYEQKNKAQFQILKSFFPGIGEYMFSITIVCTIYFILFYFIFDSYMKILGKFISENFPKDFIQTIAHYSQKELITYLETNISVEQLQNFLLLILGLIVILYIFNMFVLWFAPAVFYTSKNPITAIFQAIKFMFTHFGASFIIVGVMFLIHMFLSLFNPLLNNQFLAFIPMFLFFLYIMYYVITVFLYYEKETQNNCNSGPECNREV